MIGGGFIGSEIAAALAMNEQAGHDDFSGKRNRCSRLPARPLLNS